MEDEYEHLAELMDILEDGFKKIHKRLDTIEQKLEREIKDEPEIDYSHELDLLKKQLYQQYQNVPSPREYYSNNCINTTPYTTSVSKVGSEDCIPEVDYLTTNQSTLTKLKNALSKFST